MRIRNRRAIVVATLAAVLAAMASMTGWGAAPGWAAVAGPDLTAGARHDPSHVVPSMVAANLYLTVRNAGSRRSAGTVTVTDPMPAGLTSSFAGGDGWTCSGKSTVTCTRADGLAAGHSYPSIHVLVDVAADAPAVITNTATVAGGGDVDPANDSAQDAIAARDGCPWGWSPEQNVTFAPPFRPGRPGGIDSGVRNPQSAGGCTLLDDIWNAEPFQSHAGFVATVAKLTSRYVGSRLLTKHERDAIVSTAARSEVGTAKDHQVDNSCTNRMALTFDDGTSSYRPQLLKLLREKQVHATFFDNGVRVEANPQWARFQVREGHIEMNHTYTHVHMDELTPDANREEVEHNKAVLANAGAPITFLGIRPPFGGSNPNVQQLVTSMGYTSFLNRIDGEDWLPDKSAEDIADDIIAKIHPGVIVGMHDGPIDTTAGAQTVRAVGMIIDRARAMGYCFGVVDHSGQVVADRYVSSGESIPSLVNPVPYHLPLAFGTPDRIPEPWVRVPSPLHVSATHAPAAFTRGGTGTLKLTVHNSDGRQTDGNAVTVTDTLPSGLTATAASGDGWTCKGTAEVTCSRSDGLAKGRAYPPINVTVTVASDAPVTVTNSAALVAHGETWTHEDSDPLPVG
jgi:uncharacterized repeat protein (TIGR01451 family)